MTEEEIEKQAVETSQRISRPCIHITCNQHCSMVKQSFQDGAKWGIANAIEWHDLREDPNDLPKTTERKMYRVIYANPMINEPCLWYLPNLKSWSHSLPVIAWCELPQFKDKE